MVYLKKLSLGDGIAIYNMLQEIVADDNGFHNKVYGMTFDEFKIWIAKEYSYDNGNLESWMVPQSSYWMYDDDVPIGYGRIRHYLNNNLKETSGHIGYAIAVSKRGRGYGNSILALLKEECVKLELEVIQIGAKAENSLSNKVILKNGGVFLRESHGKNFYSVNLSK
ncbi:GNAT family N-acetyltransferase [Paludicola sp. MB14-C6]|uniref:GNAT family N-acetyltransferase n=1 Tax=Paludihabitans sp. MB14-C6 TaxID=3070656 RepID=UPI0027DC609C|nr:GNAT family N-acetyltransferase [Paludicola sp. MB14-C6]WMJ23783.1 GNAT family N-acetyltransferase [Paludicola sp. MB14-C6]